MLSTVPVPMTFAGFLMSMRGRRAARGEQRIGRDAESRSDCAAEKLTFFREYIEGGRGAHIDDDAWTAKALECRDAIDDSVGAKFDGIVDQDWDTGLYAGFDEQWFYPEVKLADLTESGVERRHDGRDSDSVDDGDLEALQFEEVAQ